MPSNSIVYDFPCSTSPSIWVKSSTISVDVALEELSISANTTLVIGSTSIKTSSQASGGKVSPSSVMVQAKLGKGSGAIKDDIGVHEVAPAPNKSDGSIKTAS